MRARYRCAKARASPMAGGPLRGASGAVSALTYDSNVSTDEWRSKAGPWARATLADGQHLDVLVTGRERTADGQWWYHLEALLTSRYIHADGRITAAAAPTAFIAPAEAVAPLPGESYADVPTMGAVSGRQWIIQKVHRYQDRTGRLLHRRDCWRARGSEDRVTTQEAYRLVADAEADVCEVCRPDRALPT